MQNVTNHAGIRDARAGAVLVPELVLKADSQQRGIIRVPLRKV